MNLLDFSSYFPDEASCVEYFKTQREKLGLICKKCNGTAHYWKKDKIAFQCKKCGYRTALRSSNKLEMVIKQHIAITTSEIKEVHTFLPWVHSAIGNAKRILDGIHHSNGENYLQNYLNEYCYKYNRRYFGEKLFDRLLLACIENS